MNYRHSFHAGNFADVMKHALLARVLLHLCAKDTPFRVIDTHAGSGRYNLGSDDAARTGEWHEGIGRLMALAIPAEIEALLAPYFSCAKPLLAEKPPRYPGSPAIVQALTRRQDRLSFIELHQHDFRKLQGVLAGDRRAKALCLDAWTAWNAQVPPPERRGLVLVDPPFEQPDDFARMVAGLVSSHKKWPGGTVMLWYPVKNPRNVNAFHAALQETGIRKILCCELYVDRIDTDGPLAGSGLILINPPWTLKPEADALLAFFAGCLSRGGWSGWRSEWLVPE